MSVTRTLAALFLVTSAFLTGCAGVTEDGTAPLPSTEVNPDAVNLKGGAHAKPAFVDNGVTLSASGAFSGLGNTDLVVNLTATGNANSTCTTPSGKNEPNGQNPVEVTLSGSQSISADAIKNGTVAFNLTTAAPSAEVIDGILAGAPGCPNPHWIQSVDIAFTSATITVEQSGLTFNLACTFSPPTSNGAVASQTVTCAAQ